MFRLPLDAYVTADEIVVLANMPGVKPEEVEITIEGDTLTIRGERPRPLENVDYVMQERPFGKFQRTLNINIPVDANKAEGLRERAADADHSEGRGGEAEGDPGGDEAVARASERVRDERRRCCPGCSSGVVSPRRFTDLFRPPSAAKVDSRGPARYKSTVHKIYSTVRRTQYIFVHVYSALVCLTAHLCFL